MSHFFGADIDVAINLGMSVHHIESHADISLHLSSLRKCLVRDGIYIIDFLVHGNQSLFWRHGKKLHTRGISDDGREWTCAMTFAGETSCTANTWLTNIAIRVKDQGLVHQHDWSFSYQAVQYRWLLETIWGAGYAIESVLSADRLGFPEAVSDCDMQGHLIFILRAI